MILRNMKGGFVLAGLAVAVGASLAGCGGSSSSNLPTSGSAVPIAYGRQPSGVGKGYEVSGLGSNSSNAASTNPLSNDVAYLTFASNFSGALVGGSEASYLGLAPGAEFYGEAATPPVITASNATNLFFRAEVASGKDPSSGSAIPVTSVTLTFPDISPAPAAQPLTYQYLGNPAPAGPFSKAEYVTPLFQLPYNGPNSTYVDGVETLRITVVDSEGNTTYTDYQVVVLGAGDAAAVGTVPVGSNVTIDNAATPPGSGSFFYTSFPTTPTTAQPDTYGTVVLFAKPDAGGPNTITINGQTQQVQLTAGQATYFQ